ncbi:hypothetical protein DES43_1607 [Aquamicrobium defluvii]|uniref:Uncharacterized protein n=1 Tax=Aquamicrobium defluvii TaxID=69279 RepID=A0A4R6Y0C3_9HYPH|nr:hypothetical protein DES43_1607 [Aquamicrobium defluvii]
MIGISLHISCCTRRNNCLWQLVRIPYRFKASHDSKSASFAIALRNAKQPTIRIKKPADP